MKSRKTLLRSFSLVLSVSFILIAGNLWSQTYWSGAAGPTATNWSTAANWIDGTGAGGIAGANDTATFTITNAAAGLAISQPGTGVIDTPANIDSFVDAAFPGSIAGLTLTNSGAYQNLLLNPGMTLSITGGNGLTVGNKSVDFGGAVQTYVAIMGPQSSVNVNNPNATVFFGQNSATSGCRMNVDLSALGSLTSISTNFLVAVGSSSEGVALARPGAVVYLARTNFITATATGTSAETSDTANNAVGLDVSDSDGNADSLSSFLYLGWTNVIYANAICTARQKAPASAMLFNPNLVNILPFPTAYFRAADGVSPVTTWTIADGAVNSGSSVSPLGTNDFSGGMVNALVNTMYIGHTTSSQTPARACTGTLTFDAGLITVNSLYVGYQTTSEPSWGVGTVNVGTNAILGLGATLLVNTNFVLGYTVGGTGAANGNGTLNINGGAVDAYSIIAGVGLGTINMYGGVLQVSNSIGAPTIPITSLSLSNSTLTVPVGNTPSVWVTGLTLDGQSTTTNVINVTGLPFVAAYPAVFHVIQMTNVTQATSGTLTLLNGTFNVALGNLPGTYSGYLTNDPANSSIDLVVVAGPSLTAPLTWDGTASGNWNTSDLNWKAASGPDTAYVDGDFVTFDDSLKGTANVNLALTVHPGSVTFNNNVTNYVLSGAGSLAGETGLNVAGAGMVILDNAAANTFLGPITVAKGNLQVGNNDANGTLPNNSVTLGGTLTFMRSDAVAFPNIISGTGVLVQSGSNSVTFAGDSFDFTGTVIINSGTVRIGAANALGSGTNSQIINTNGGTLDFDSTFGTNQALVGGAGVTNQGALVNNGPTAVFPACSFVTMAADTTFGGSQRWDIRPGSSLSDADSLPPTAAGLSTGGHPYNLTKVGGGQVGLVSATVDPALAAIDIRGGVLDFEGTTTGLGNPAASVTVESNAYLMLYSAANPLDKVIVLNDAATITNGAGNNTIAGPILLNTNVPSGAAARAIFGTGGANGTYLTVLSTISGAGSLIKTGTNQLYLQGTNSYTGSTMVNAGTLYLTQQGAISNSFSIVVASNATLDVSQLNTPWNVPAGQTLMGNGTVNGSATILPGATISAGTNAASVGMLTLNSTATLAGTTLIKVDAAGATNDVLNFLGGAAYGGQLVISNLSATPLQAGQTFTIFSGSYSGAFASVATASGLVGWNTNNLSVNGSITAVNLPAFTAAAASGTNLVLKGVGGAVGGAYYILSTTNLALPLKQWTIVATNTFDSQGNFTYSVPISLSSPALFYTFETH
ncbi:MAG TPA: autotransporter-associated beta strand repeat-containing protein [Candidatus Saccharimonadales bacterium]|nr:autotransporter-associated beta strand repeat-containing protein [Candidatus Saccharimonadales bacterium]